MSIENLAAGSKAFALPLTMQFRNTKIRKGLVFEGTDGWGEFAPFDNYDDEISGRWLAGALEQAFTQWPDPIRSSVPINAIIPAVDATTAAALTFRAVVESGMTTLKVKVAEPGQSVEEDLARLEAIRLQLSDLGVTDVNIRIDVNGGWSAPDAIKLIGKYEIAAGGLDYIEQPCADLADVVRIRAELGVQVAVDEIIRKSEDPSSLRLAGMVDFAICKPMTVGGVHATLAIAASVGVPVVISGSLDTSVGLAASIAAAAALPELTTACGLGTGVLLSGDVTSEPLLPRNGRVPVGRIAPDRDALVHAGQAIAQDRAKWWRDRLQRAYASYARMHADLRMGG